MWRGGLGEAYRWPTLSSVGASLASPCFRFHTSLIEPEAPELQTSNLSTVGEVVVNGRPDQFFGVFNGPLI
jgi:hypothetical protein